MILTSQNRIAVLQTNSVNDRGQVLAAVVVHQPSTMRPYSGMRRTRLPFGIKPTFFGIETSAGRSTPASAGQLWVRFRPVPKTVGPSCIVQDVPRLNQPQPRTFVV